MEISKCIQRVMHNVAANICQAQQMEVQEARAKKKVITEPKTTLFGLLVCLIQDPTCPIFLTLANIVSGFCFVFTVSFTIGGIAKRFIAILHFHILLALLRRQLNHTGPLT